MGYRKVTIILEEEQYRQLEELKKKRGFVKLSEVVRYVIAKGLENEGKER